MIIFQVEELAALRYRAKGRKFSQEKNTSWQMTAHAHYEVLEMEGYFSKNSVCNVFLQLATNGELYQNCGQLLCPKVTFQLAQSVDLGWIALLSDGLASPAMPTFPESPHAPYSWHLQERKRILKYLTQPIGYHSAPRHPAIKWD